MNYRIQKGKEGELLVAQHLQKNGKKGWGTRKKNKGQNEENWNNLAKPLGSPP